MTLDPNRPISLQQQSFFVQEIGFRISTIETWQLSALARRITYKDYKKCLMLYYRRKDQELLVELESLIKKGQTMQDDVKTGGSDTPSDETAKE